MLALFLVLSFAVACDSSPAQNTPTAPVEADADARPAEAPITDVPLAKPETLPPWTELWVGGAKAGDTVPLIVALHGLGDKPETFGRLLEAYPHPARVLLPRGPIAQTLGSSWFPIARNEDGSLGSQPEIEAAADRIAEVVEAQLKATPAAGKPVVTGFSQGGILCWALAVRHPDLFAAIFPIAGALPPAMQTPPDHVPTIVAFHGDKDGRIPFRPTNEMAEAWKAKGLPVTMTPFAGVAHHTTGPMRTALYEAIHDATAAKVAP